MSAGKLQLTNGYEVNFDQMARFLAAMERDGRTRIPIADLGNAIGVSYRQAENIGSIVRALALAQPLTYQLTAQAKVINANDRFFDDTGTLWFLHYVIASESRHIVWNRLVNEVVPGCRRFTRDEFRAAFTDLSDNHSLQSAQKHVLKEVNVVLNAYIHQNFRQLAYLVPEGDAYASGYVEAVPPLVLAACIARYRDHHRPGDTALPVSDLLSGPNSPGVVCQIPEDRLRAGLEALKTQPGFRWRAAPIWIRFDLRITRRIINGWSGIMREEGRGKRRNVTGRCHLVRTDHAPAINDRPGTGKPRERGCLPATWQTMLH